MYSNANILFVVSIALAILNLGVFAMDSSLLPNLFVGLLNVVTAVHVYYVYKREF